MTDNETPDTFASDIEEVVGDEPIEAIVIQRAERYGDDDPKLVMGNERAEIVLSWAEARLLLDYEFDSGFGGQDCHDVTFWTPTRVFHVHEYDGSTSLRYVYRNPTAGKTDGWVDIYG